MSEQDKAAANAGKTLAGTPGTGDGFDKSGGKGPATEISEADAAIMKQKAIAAAAAKQGG